MNPTFQYYKAQINASQPLGIITLDRFKSAILEPKDYIMEALDLIRQAEVDQDWTKKADLKQHLYSFTPCVYVIGRRRYSDIHNFTGLMVLDFDHLESTEYAEGLRDYLFEEHPEIVGTWLSASRYGIRALVRIPIVQSVDEYKAYFDGFYMQVGALYETFDKAPKNAVLPMFISYDKEAKFREYEDAEEWRVMYIKPEPERVVQLVQPREISADLAERRISGIATSAISKITNEGHIILRGTAFTIGGYVASGAVSWDFAEDLMFSLIDNHSYLNKKANTYKKTVIDMFKRSANKPLYLN